VRLQKFFEEAKERHLSGVVIFHDDLDGAMYFYNSYAAEPSKLSKEDIAKIGFKWFQFEEDKPER
jgi:hypothetical protein